MVLVQHTDFSGAQHHREMVLLLNSETHGVEMYLELDVVRP